eukprot:762521-Hanusia_phi.AAC.26
MCVKSLSRAQFIVSSSQTQRFRPRKSQGDLFPDKPSFLLIVPSSCSYLLLPPSPPSPCFCFSCLLSLPPHPPPSPRHVMCSIGDSEARSTTPTLSWKEKYPYHKRPKSFMTPGQGRQTMARWGGKRSVVCAMRTMQ